MIKKINDNNTINKSNTNSNILSKNKSLINENKYSEYNDVRNDSQNDDQIDNIIFDPIIRNALEYYDKFQPKIQEILDKIEYIKIIDGVNVNDEYIFYDSNNNQILKSRIETLSLFTPENNTWRWSWSVPFIKYKNNLISRKILEYAFTLNTDSDLFLKSALINSKIIISNQYQIDIYMGLAAMLSKKPFVFKLYLNTPDESDKSDKSAESDSKGKKINNTGNIYHYKKIINNPDKKKFISVFILIIDWNPDINY